MIISKRFLITLLFHIYCTTFICGQANSCDSAPILCGLGALDGYSSSMPQFNPIDEPPTFCGGTGNPQNMTWFAFLAGSSNASLEITFINCAGGTGLIQYGIYTDCSFSEFLPSACAGIAESPDAPIIINIDGMIPGDDYYLFIDGDLGTYCDYTIIVNSGSGSDILPDPESLDCISADCSSDGVICSLGNTLTFQPADTNIPADYIWTITPGPPNGPAGITTNPGNTASFTFDNPGEYEICVVVDDGCYQTNPVCYELNVFPDADNDGTCDTEDLCPDSPEPGSACDDGDICTIDDIIDSNCSCMGTFQDADNDGTCDAEDACPDSPEPETICDDGDICTIDDIVDSDCNCTGTYIDSDNDGTCDAEDLCPDAPEPGTTCDDGDICTIDDIIDSDCNCIGTFLDADNDGTCDAEDLCPGAPEPGTPCDDQNICTIDDVIQMNCFCIGTYLDADNDGTCDAEDICPDAPEPGTSCDDNDLCTIDDIIDMNCNCIGTFLDTDEDGTCDFEDICPDSPEPGTSCDDNDLCTINDTIDMNCNCIGTFLDTDEDGTCDAEDLCPDAPEPGTFCDDNDHCTIDDIIDENCNCIGTFLDSDNDGTCDAEDICPNSSEPGTPCDDGDINTLNDQVNLDCNCEGTTDPNYCPGLNLSIGDMCDDGDDCTVNDIVDSECSCIGTFEDSDNDGTCNANDLCTDSPEPGTDCDDENENTFNDQIDENCNCIGTDDPNYCPGLDQNIGDQCDDNDVCTINDIVNSECQCIGIYQDTDNDGTCDADDVCQDGPEPGTVCDDGDSTTQNDVITENCICLGEDPNSVYETKLDLKIYPNPIKDNLVIEVQGQHQIQLYTLEGKIILKTQMINKINLDFSKMESGIYILSISNESSSASKKLLKI